MSNISFEGGAGGWPEKTLAVHTRLDMLKGIPYCLYRLTADYFSKHQRDISGYNVKITALSETE